jgi:hypothetical protein
MDNDRMDGNKLRRRWLSFGIRDLIWSMVVVGLAIGWWQDRQTLGSYRDALLTLRNLGLDIGSILNSPSLKKELEVHADLAK